MMVVDVIEAALDVAFDDPLIRWARPTLYGLLAGWADRVADMLQSVTTRFLRPKAVRDGKKVRLEDWFQQLQDRGLDDPIPHGRYPKRAKYARLATLWDHHTPHRRWTISSCSELSPQPGEKALCPLASLNGPDRDLVRSRRARATIARDASPRQPKVAGVGDPVPQVSVGIIGFGPTPRVKFALNVEKPDFVSLINGVHRLFPLRGKRTRYLFPFAM